MIEMDDVREWCTEKKRKYTYGHIVMGRQDYWVTTACRIMSPSFDIIKTRDDFDRICPKCKKAMAYIELIKEEKNAEV